MGWVVLSGASYSIVDIDAETCGDNCKIDIIDKLSKPVTDVLSLSEFKDMFTSELIDAKFWKTETSYPTLRLIYDRYMNSINYCDTLSSQFDYRKMSQFSDLVGTYWVDIIEQVIPATTLWGSTKIYSNTMFDQQKFTYKKGTLFTCSDSFCDSNECIGNEPSVGVETTTIYITESTSKPKITKCVGVYMKQINYGSDFIGNVKILNDNID